MFYISALIEYQLNAGQSSEKEEISGIGKGIDAA